MQRSSIWSALLAITAAAGLLVFILRSALGGPPSDPRPDDIAGAQKELPAAPGRDDRITIPETRGVAGNGIVEPADRETKVAGQAPGRIAVVHVKEGDQVEAGQLLLELEAATERASLAAAVDHFEATLGGEHPETSRARVLLADLN